MLVCLFQVDAFMLTRNVQCYHLYECIVNRYQDIFIPQAHL